MRKLFFSWYEEKAHTKSLLSILLVFLTVTVFIITSGIYYFFNEKEKILEEQYEYLNSISLDKQTQLINWIQEKTADYEILRTSIFLRDKSILNDQNKILYRFNELTNVVKKYYPFRNIFFVDGNFKIIFNSASDKFILEKTDTILISESIKDNNVYFSDTSERTSARSKIRFYLPFANIDDNPKNQYCLIIELNPLKVFEPILNRHFDNSQTIESILLKTAGDSIVYLNKLRFLTDDNTKVFDRERKALLRTNAIKGRRGFVEGVDYKNDIVIAQIQKVPGTAWFLITKIDKSEFLEPINNLAQIVTFAVSSMVLTLLLILIWIWKRNIASNIEKMYKSELEKVKLENRFETLVNGVKDIAIYIMDRRGNIITWNEGAKNIKGYTEEEIIGKNFSLFYPPEALKKDEPAKIMYEAEVKGTFQSEGWRVRKDGSKFYANFSITSLKDAQNKIYGFLKITRDLTENRRIEEEIRKSRDFYLKLLEDFPNPVWRFGVDGKSNYFNNAWLNYTGRTIDEELGDGWVDNIHPDEKDKIIQIYNEAFNKRQSFKFEFRLRNSIGDYRWQINYGIPFYGTNGEFLGFFGSCYDIDEMKKYEETISTLLRISEKLYSSLEVDQILDSLVTESVYLAEAERGYAVILRDKNYETKRYYNQNHWEYFEKQYSINDLIITKFSSGKNGLILDAITDMELIDNEISKKYSIKQALSIPLYDSNHQLLGFLELHDRKQNKKFTRENIDILVSVTRNASIAISKSLNYEKLREAEKQLRISESELRDLAAQIQYAREAERQKIAREVHDELGQLFTGINLNISLLTEILEQNQKHSISEILDELYSVQQYVNKGIQVVRDISGSLRSYVLDHLGLIPAVSEYCREIERISNIECKFETELEYLKFEDEKKVALFRIIQEAITNVIRHADAKTINIRFDTVDNKLRIIISDDGKGIKNFDTDNGRNSIGILGMKERTIFLGGTINIESINGKGTTIIILIPNN